MRYSNEPVTRADRVRQVGVVICAALALVGAFVGSGAAGGTLGMARVVGQSLGAVVVAFLLSAAPINGVGHGFQIAAVTALFGAVMSGSRVRRRPAEPDKEVEAV